MVIASNNEFKLFSYIYGQFDEILTSYIGDTVANLSSTLSGFAYMLFGIYVLLWGISMIRNMIEEPVVDGVVRITKIALILGLALNTGLYMNYVVDFFMTAPEAMAREIVVSGSAQEVQGIGETADALITKSMEVTTHIWDEANIFNGNFGHYIIAMVFATASLVICSIGFFMIMVAKICLVFMLAVGPIFILMLMFQSTQRFFEAWISQLVNFMVTIIFVGAAVTMVFSLFEKVTAHSATLAFGDQILMGMVQMAAVSIMGTWLLFQVSSLASAVSSGVNLGISSFTGKLHGSGIADAAGRRASRSVVSAGATAANAVAAKATGGATAAARAVGNMFRAKNSIKSS